MANGCSVLMAAFVNNQCVSLISDNAIGARLKQLIMHLCYIVKEIFTAIKWAQPSTWIEAL